MREAAEPRRRGRPAAIDREDRRALVLEAFGRTFSVADPGSLSMDAIARAAGMSKRTLYGLFEDRGALFMAYFDRIGRDFIRELPPEAQDLPLRERLVLMLEPRPQGPSMLPLEIMRCIIAEAPERPDMARAFFRQVHGRATGLVRAELDRAMDRGELRACDTAMAAAILLDMIKPNTLGWLLDPGANPCLDGRRARFSAALDIALGGLSAAR